MPVRPDYSKEAFVLELRVQSDAGVQQFGVVILQPRLRHRRQLIRRDHVVRVTGSVGCGRADVVIEVGGGKIWQRLREAVESGESKGLDDMIVLRLQRLSVARA